MLSFAVVDWCALAPGLEDNSQWHQWACSKQNIDAHAAPPKPSKLPSMTARRLASGSKLAVDCGLQMLSKHKVDAVVYASRHGELEKNFRILSALAHQQDVSPTDFALSVHNAAVGNLTINAGAAIPSSSVTAGLDSFQQSLFEVFTLLKAGHKSVLLVDFDGYLPDFYHEYLPESMPKWPFAVALLLQEGSTHHCYFSAHANPQIHEPELPQSLNFLSCFLRAEKNFTVQGERGLWHWRVE